MLNKLHIHDNNLVDKVIECVLLGKNSIRIISESNRSDLAESNRIRLRSLYRNVTQIERETGLQETYLGFPFLVGRTNDNELTYVRGPVVLFPVSIEFRRETKPGWYLVPSQEKPPTLNRALLTAIKKNAGLGISDSFMEEFEDLIDKIRNLKNGVESKFIDEFSNLLLQNEFPLEVPKNNTSTNKVKILKPINGYDVDEQQQNLHLENYKIIGNFPQGDSAIYFDYEELLKKTKSGDTEHGIIGNLLKTSSYDARRIWSQGNEDGNDDSSSTENTKSSVDLQAISAEDLSLAIESDPSQDEIVIASQDAECLVVRGPPGTGKSQVIVNLISDALAKHKRVLLVCQKRAALDIVYQRLDKVGLAKYAALLHDPSKDRKKIYYQMEQLLKSKTDTDDFNKINSRFKHCSQRIDNLKISLSNIATALWRPYFGGISAHQLYLLTDPNYRSKLDLSDVAPQIEYYQLDEILQAMKNLVPGCRKFDMLDHYPWIARADFSKLSLSDKNNLDSLIDEISNLLRERNTAILTYNKEDQRILFESLKELSRILGLFSTLEYGCKKYDNTHHAWSNRHDFSSLTHEDKKKIELTIDKISGLLQERAAINLHNVDGQQTLCSSLDVLIEETGVFRKLKPKWIQAQHNVRRLLGEEDIPNDITYLRKLRTQAIRGLDLWKAVDELLGFLDEKGSELIRNYVSSAELESIPPILYSMKESLNKFDELVSYDKKKRELLSMEVQLQDGWNNAHSSITKLLNQSNAQDNNEVMSYLRSRTEKGTVFWNTVYTVSSLLTDTGFNELRNILTGSQSEPPFSKISNMAENISYIISKVEKGLSFWNTVYTVSPFLTDIGFNELRNELLASDITKVRYKLQMMKEALIEFDQLQAHDAKKAALTLIQRKILDICTKRLSSEERWDEILKQEFYSEWINFIERDNPCLRGDPFESYLQDRGQLSNLIKEHRKLVVQKISTQIEKGVVKPDIRRKPNSRGQRSRNDVVIPNKRGEEEEETEWIRLRHDLGKKTHTLSVRKLIENYQSIIFDIAPCWLASPEAVSSVFPLQKHLFDCIIFDEASQTAVEKSLPSLYRGDHIIITGDENQLRPFDLFKIKTEEDDHMENDDGDDTLLSESLLILAKRIYGRSYLSWHYRSKYQELIDFSNHAFYDGDLQVAPNTWLKEPINPIRWVECKDGIWLERKNRPEAVAVVTELKNILLQNKKYKANTTVGTITFSSSQQEAIQDEIDRRRKSDPQFNRLMSGAENPKSGRLDDIPFIKNIENVQGDERDIIIFSIGYAQDSENPDGDLPLRFGTLNQEGGENRLNVAITRARQSVVIVCSIDLSKLRTDKSKNDGPKRLKDYLLYAKAVSENRRQDAQIILESISKDLVRKTPFSHDTSPIFDHFNFEKLVQNKLQNLGYQVDTHIGNSDCKIDIAVRHPDEPNRYILAIETDGESFRSARSTLERDITRQEFLESKGWKVERVWSRNWWRDSDREVNRIHHKIQELRKSKDYSTLIAQLIAIDNSISIAPPAEDIDNLILQQQQKLPAEINYKEMLEKLIKNGESDILEFKSSIKTPVQPDAIISSIEGLLGKAEGQEKIKLQKALEEAKKNLTNSLEHEIIKTIAAFMNTKGGKLLVGVDDNHAICGIQRDFETFKDKKNWDGWLQHLTNLIDKRIMGKNVMTYIKSKPIPNDGQLVALIEVEKSSKEVYVKYKEKGQEKEELYIRALNTTRTLGTTEIADYVHEHWRNKGIE